MKMTLVRNVYRDGPKKGQPKTDCVDAFMATIEGAPRAGIGKSRTKAIGSLVSANLEFFGITEREDIDPTSEHPIVTWKSTRETPPACS